MGLVITVFMCVALFRSYTAVKHFKITYPTRLLHFYFLCFISRYRSHEGREIIYDHSAWKGEQEQMSPRELPFSTHILFFVGNAATEANKTLHCSAYTLREHPPEDSPRRC